MENIVCANTGFIGNRFFSGLAGTRLVASRLPNKWPKNLLDELKVEELATLRVSTVDQDFELKQVDGHGELGNRTGLLSQQVRNLLLALLETKVGDVGPVILNDILDWN